MRVACVDRTAALRVVLQKYFEQSYERCRHSIGNVNLAQTIPCKKEELLVNAPPDVVAVGPGFGVEEAYALCREISRTFPGLPILVFLAADAYSLRSLRRFQKVCSDVFSMDDPPTRLIYKLSSFEENQGRSAQGKLITVIGVKGGVGTTSVVSGLAHAAEAVGKTAVVVDLSASGAFTQYMSAQRWQSPDFTALLTEGLVPDRAAVERCLTTAPNGINILLPPSGSTDIRELWVRDSSRFEITLAAIEVLKEIFDVVIVDTAAVEGVLPFALNSRAHARLLITSNDPASVHLLTSKLAELMEIPGDAQTQVLVNILWEGGLNKEDIVDFLYGNENFNELMAVLDPIPFDSRGRHWIGTGNTFYTESATAVQELFETALSTLLLSADEVHIRQEKKRTIFGGLRELAERATRRKSRVEGVIRALPAPTASKQAPRLTRLKPLSAASDSASEGPSLAKIIYATEPEPTNGTHQSPGGRIVVGKAGITEAESSVEPEQPEVQASTVNGATFPQPLYVSPTPIPETVTRTAS